MRLPISVMPAARSTVDTFMARETASSGKVGGASPPEKVPSAEATIRLVLIFPMFVSHRLWRIHLNLQRQQFLLHPGPVQALSIMS